jgi:iduronate 2-sulfatase
MKFLSFLLLLALAPTTHAADDAPRNILLLVSDDLKASVLGCYGDRFCDTPNIDALAERGMVFDRAYCQGTVCGPSRRSFMRSRYTDKSGLTLGEHLIANDWYTARVGKIFHMRVPGDIIAGTNGEDIAACWTERFNSQGQEAHTPGNYSCLNLNIFTTDLENRESTRMKNRMFVAVDYVGDGSDQPDFKTAQQTVKLLKQRAKDEDVQPFFIAAGFVRPHYPNVAPEQYFEPYPYEDMPLPESVPNDLDDIPAPGKKVSTSASTGIGKFPDNQRRMWSAYYATVTFMDEQVGRVLDELDQLGLRDTTTVIFTSDHGYHLGEHTFWQKNNLHEEVIRVPLIIDSPNSEHAPGRSDSLVELVDIYPTACELSGVKIPDSVEGTNLIPVLTDPDAKVHTAARSFANGGESLRTSDWAYMRYKDGSEELYDMNADPKQFTNLAKDHAHAERLAEMRKQWKELQD